MQAVPGVGSAGAALPGVGLPGETPELGPAPAELTRFGLAAGIGETDNVSLSATDPKAQTIAATDLDFDLRRTGSHLDAAALGDFTDLDYLQGAYSNQVLGRFDGLATAKLWSDRLKWVAGDDFGEEQTDPFAAITPANLQRVNVFTTGPDLTLRPGYSTFINLDGRYNQMSYQTSPFDGHNLVGSAQFGRQVSPLSSLSLVVQAEELRFQNTTVNTDYDRREAYGRYLIEGARTAIDLQLGATQANDLGASWKTSPLARLLLTRRISPFSLLTIAGGREYTDGGGSFANLRSGAGGGIVVAPPSQTTASYLRDYGSAGWQFARLRTTFGLTGDWERDIYDLQSLYNVTRVDLGLNLGRALTPKLSVNVSGSADRYEYLNQGLTDKFGTVGAGLTYRPGRWLVIYARYDHSFRRSGSSAVTPLASGLTYDENRVFIMIGYRPHSDSELGGEPGSGGMAGP
ncbi:MAG: outer membrane beta-barrel protein [Steroidobacteraceae bacterium]